MVDTPFEISSFITSGGYKLHYRHFHPVGIAKGTIVFIHGIQSHGGWYETSCKKFAQAGYRVLFFVYLFLVINQMMPRVDVNVA